MIVVDASAWVVSLISGGADGMEARRVLAGDHRWVAPAHAPIEVLRTIRRYESAELLTTDSAQIFAAEVLAAEVEYVGPERWLLATVWGQRHNLSAYDAPYVAIAQQRGVPLVTFDIRLAKAAWAGGVEVIGPAGRAAGPTRYEQSTMPSEPFLPAGPASDASV